MENTVKAKQPCKYNRDSVPSNFGRTGTDDSCKIIQILSDLRIVY